MSPFYNIAVPFALGLTFFLLGMYAMRIGFQNLAGDRMKALMMRFTRTPVHSFFSGLISTFVLQSSGAVTVLTIGLTQAGIIRFAQTIGIILGANIGSTITTQLIALRLEKLAVPMLLIGVIFWLQSRKLYRCIGLIIAGFGLIFLGIDTMQVMARPLEESQTFRGLFLESSHSIWIGLITGTLFSGLIQSGSATIAITMNLLAHGVMNMDTALAVVLGANVGTCFTALIASIGTNRASQQVAWFHTLFNLAGAISFIPLLGSLASITATLTDDPSQQIAHAQSIFNVACSVIALPFVSILAKWMDWIIPNGKEPNKVM
ncbi:Na/Pi cotransporter family protein [Brevibacillus fluminis]|uniref:Na/Pi cotransporter family protein n=1 Tax=Brevibacillus fluminis TaxID=511487 RepID=A0A3M8D4C9_9BACL|nr:Na/Pi symporter [Brevibacillus fluminis]RNB82297.1 Na/Pi cotransporter family protein [Brevibacillus fluminis]